MDLLNDQHSRRSTRRSGMTLVEITVTLAMLGVAAGAVAKLAAIQSRLTRQHEVRLVATLQSQNATERLRRVNYDQLADAVTGIENDATFENLRLSLSPFETDDAKGLHLQIDVMDIDDKDRVLATEHLWRIQSVEGDSNASE